MLRLPCLKWSYHACWYVREGLRLCSPRRTRHLHWYREHRAIVEWLSLRRLLFRSFIFSFLRDGLLPCLFFLSLLAFACLLRSGLVLLTGFLLLHFDALGFCLLCLLLSQRLFLASDLLLSVQLLILSSQLLESLLVELPFRLFLPPSLLIRFLADLILMLQERNIQLLLCTLSHLAMLIESRM